MSFISIIILILLCFSLTDFILPRNKRLHEQLYKVAFFITFFLFTIKYYYGADVINYYRYFSLITSPLSVLEADDNVFEIGFMLYMSIIKWLGLSYWWVTAFVSVIYFYAIYKLFELIPTHKIFALFILVVLDYNLIFATHRQCLAVSFFILMYFAYVNKKYFQTITYAILTITMHKSGIVYVLPTLFLWGINFKVRKADYFVCLLLLVIISFIPLKEVMTYLTAFLPLSEAVKISLMHHISFLSKSMGMMLFYIVILSLIFFFSVKDPRFNEMHVIIFIGAVYIFMFNQSNAVLWRLRSYFLPFMIVYIFYIFNKVRDEQYVEINKLRKNLVSPILISSFCYVLMFVLYLAYSANISMTEMPSRIYETCTIFDLIDRTEEEIKVDRLQRAQKYWKAEKMYIKKLNEE